MTQEELFQQLSAIRLPISYAKFTEQDALLAVSLGLFAGLLLAKLIGLITARSVSAIDLAQSKIDALSKMAPDRRLVGLSELLQQHAPEQLTKLASGNGLYDPAKQLEPTDLETAILTAVKRRAE